MAHIFTPALRRPLSKPFAKSGTRTLIQRAIASLRARGSDAHLWLPGGDVKTYGAELVTNGVIGLAGTATAATYSTPTGVGAVTRVDVSNQSFVQWSGLNANATYEVIITCTSGVAVNVRSGSQAGTVAATIIAGNSQTVGVIPAGGLITITSSSGAAGFTVTSVREITSITSTITSGLTTGNYLESTGNTVATVDNPTGLVLDALGSVGVELVTNGEFADATGWTVPAGWAVGSGVAAVTAASSSLLCTQYTPVTGKTYLVTFDCTVTGGTLYVATGSGTAASFTTSGPKRCILVCGATPSRAIEWYGGAVSGSVDNISVREVSGIHLTQTTTANKPLLRRGAYNLLTNSVLAGGTSGVEGSGAVAPTSWSFGASTGSVTFASESIRFVAAAQRPFIVQTTTSLSVGVYVLTVRVLSVGAVTTVADIIGVGVGTATVSVTYIKNNAACLSSATYSAGDTVGAVLTVTVAGTVPARVGCGAAGASTGDVTLSSPQFEVGSTASAYSPTTTAAASNPDAGRYSWSCDSTDLLTATFPAGYESVTVIDAKSTGQVTTSAANVVGSYSIGPSYSSYGRIVIKGSITASELALYQGFANRLAGL